MNESLNTSLTSINFSGKSFNNHLDWRNTAWFSNQGSNEPSTLVRPTLRKLIKEPIVNDDQPNRFLKPTRLIEKAQSHPKEVIAEVFDQVTLADLTEDLLPTWLQVVVTNTQSPYSNGNGREILYEFMSRYYC
jgi:hypothetical protein